MVPVVWCKCSKGRLDNTRCLYEIIGRHHQSHRVRASSSATTLGWMSLEDRRRKLQIVNLHKIIHGELHIDLDKYASKKITRLRRSHGEQYDVTSEFISTQYPTGTTSQVKQ